MHKLELDPPPKADVSAHNTMVSCLDQTLDQETYVDRKLPRLESLAFANRSTANDTLAQIGASLLNLRFLDISSTCVTDISCISSLRNLEVLIMYNLNIRKGDVTETLSNLRKLRVLDISRKVNTDYLQETSQDAHLDLALGIYNRSVEAIESGTATPWAELRAIDMSGLSIVQFGTDRALAFVEKIIEAHPKLEQISLLATPLDSSLIEIPNRKLQVINTVSRKSILHALSHYASLDRPAFITHTLHSVYYQLQSGYDKFSQEELKECLRLVCIAMEQGLSTLPVQIAGSACLYHLCKMKRIKRLSVKEVNACIERSLDAAEQYRSMTQLQKNVWLTICNDYLLHLEGIDFYRTCKVALGTMLLNRDASVERMTIAIVSIVTPKMRPAEAKALTTETKYVFHLVKIMNDYLEAYTREFRLGHERDNDNALYTLKFTLSALWNLTDECPATCKAFLDAGGVEIASRILKAFDYHGNVQTKVLGILNNLAEVEELNLGSLFKYEYNVLISCLDGLFNEVDTKGRYREVERSYFAAGILANLLTNTAGWESEKQREDACEKLLELIEQYPVLPSAMVSYKSFIPFCRIVQESKSNGAIMWCLWGVHHVLQQREKNQAPNFDKGSRAPSTSKKMTSSLSHPASTRSCRTLYNPGQWRRDREDNDEQDPILIPFVFLNGFFFRLIVLFREFEGDFVLTQSTFNIEFGETFLAFRTRCYVRFEVINAMQGDYVFEYEGVVIPPLAVITASLDPMDTIYLVPVRTGQLSYQQMLNEQL